MFQVIGDTIEYDGRPVAAFAPSLPATVRLAVETELDCADSAEAERQYNKSLDAQEAELEKEIVDLREQLTTLEQERGELYAAVDERNRLLRSVRRMLHAWRGARAYFGLPDDHSGLNEMITDIEEMLAA